MNDMLHRIAIANGEVAQTTKLKEGITTLNLLVEKQLRIFTEYMRPAHIEQFKKQLSMELEQFEEVCQFPVLAKKTVVGVGGAFSAGKSSLINMLLGKRRLIVQIDPTTAIPTYLIAGHKEIITALTQMYGQLDLSIEDFNSLTHEADHQHVSPSLHSILIQEPDFKWQNLALLDTPGYSNSDTHYSDRTDSQIAHIQLNDANFIIWVVSADHGVISASDIAFLKGLNPNTPKLVVISRADKKTPDDLRDIIQVTRQTLIQHKIDVTDVIASSVRPGWAVSCLENQVSLHHYLNIWNQTETSLRIIQNLDKLFEQFAEQLPQNYALQELDLLQKRFFKHVFKISKVVGLNLKQQQHEYELKQQKLEQERHKKLEAFRYSLEKEVAIKEELVQKKAAEELLQRAEQLKAKAKKLELRSR